MFDRSGGMDDIIYLVGQVASDSIGFQIPNNRDNRFPNIIYVLLSKIVLQTLNQSFFAAANQAVNLLNAVLHQRVEDMRSQEACPASQKNGSQRMLFRHKRRIPHVAL